MYSIFANSTLIYDDRLNSEEYRLIDLKLSLEDNSAGSLEFTMPPTNVGYGLDGNNKPIISRMDTDISVRRNGIEIWAGRVLKEDVDFWNNRMIFCEGELAFLNDSIQPPAEYTNRTVKQFLQSLISNHNSQVNANRQFTVGTVDVTDSTANLIRYTNYETTVDCIGTKLIGEYGGHIVVRKSGSTRYIDYLKDYSNTNTQTIEFGKNLLDFTKKWDMSNYCTIIIPLGKRLDESPIENLDAYLTVASVNSGSIYVQNNAAVAAHGKIVKVVHWDDEENATALLQKAQQYLSDIQFDKMNLELSALDLHYLNVNVEAIKLLDQIRVISTPHGLDRLFPVTKLEIPLDKPESTTFTLGAEDVTSLTSMLKNANTNMIYKIEQLPKEQVILTKAENKATEIAQDKVDKRTRGYITITQDSNGSDAMYVTNQQSVTASTKGWKWDLNGLSFATKSSGSETWNTPLVAMNMDGSIVADRITTGTLKSQNNNFSLNLNDGTMTMKKGSINIGNNAFKVDTDGSVTITKGSLNIGYEQSTRGGFLLNSDGTGILGGFEFDYNNGGLISGPTMLIGQPPVRITIGHGIRVQAYETWTDEGYPPEEHTGWRNTESFLMWHGGTNPPNTYYEGSVLGNDNGFMTVYKLWMNPEVSGAKDAVAHEFLNVGSMSLEVMNGFVKAYNDNPDMHRNMFRGQSLGSSVSTDQQKRIWNGTFLDMYIGDYWTINGIKWVIVDFDYWYNTAGTAFTKHHVVVMPETNLYNAKMNDTNVNDTGYAGSKMFTTNLNNAKTTINSAFPNLVLTRADYLVKTVNSSGLNSAADWYNCTVDIPSETMIYGSRILGNENATSLAFFGINYRQLAFFRLNPKLVTRSAMWLRDPVSTNRFCALSATGAVASYGSSGEYGVRPIFAMGPSSDPS